MKQAWTTSLFLRINSFVGRWPIFDRFMVFCSRFLLSVLFGILLFQWTIDETINIFVYNFGFLFAVALGISYILAFLCRCPRPIKQLPNIKILSRTFGTWKSFPSDHTISATFLIYAGLSTFGLGVMSFVFILSSILIAVGRVWVGAHYPRDIIGGFFVASIVLICYHFLFI